MSTYINSLSLSPPTPEAAEKIGALLEPISKIMEFPAKQVIANLQEDFTHIYFIKSGRTSHIISDENNEKLLYQLTAGWLFGNLCPDDASEDDISVYAQEKTIVYRASRKDYLALLSSNTLFSNYVLCLLGRKHSYLAAEVGNLAFNSCKTRLMRIYCSQVNDSLISDDGRWYCLYGKLTHNELAATVGSARVTISKLINELCDEGFLRIINRRAQVSVEGYSRFVSSLQGG